MDTEGETVRSEGGVQWLFIGFLLTHYLHVDIISGPSRRFVLSH